MAWGDRRAVTVVDCYKVSELRVFPPRGIESKPNMAHVPNLKVIHQDPGATFVNKIYVMALYEKR